MVKKKRLFDVVSRSEAQVGRSLYGMQRVAWEVRMANKYNIPHLK
jgi:hypothetical protein